MSNNKLERVSRETLYKHSRYNYLTVDDLGVAILHYVEPVKVNGEWVHLGTTYGESLNMVLDGLYDPIDSDKIIKRYFLHDFKMDSVWLDTFNNKMCTIGNTSVEYDIIDGYNILYVGDVSEVYKEKSYLLKHFEKLDVVDNITIGSSWFDEFGVECIIINIDTSYKGVIRTVTLVNNGDRKDIPLIELLHRKVIPLIEFLRDYTFDRKNDDVGYNIDNGYCCENCVMVDDIYILGNEPYKVTGIGSKQSISLYNGFTGLNSTESYVDFKRKYKKFDVGSIKIGDKWVSNYGFTDTYSIVDIDTMNENVTLSRDIKTKTCNKVLYSILTLLSRYKPYEG